MNKEQLLITLDRWANPTKISEFYGNLETAPGRTKFAIEKDATGYFYILESSVSYYNLVDGTIFRLRKNWSPKDWLCYTQLYTKSKELGTFTVDKPLHRELITHNGIELEYTELCSPNSEYGLNATSESFDWSLDVKQYLTDYISEAVDTAKACLEIANTNMCGVPGDICSITSRYRGSMGFFWSDIDLQPWTNLGSALKSTIQLHITATAQWVVSKGYLTLDEGRELVKEAKIKCQQI